MQVPKKLIHPKVNFGDVAIERRKAPTTTRAQWVNEINAHNRSLFEGAQGGDEELLEYFRSEHHMKVYTQEEIDLLNILTENMTKKLKEVVNGTPELDVSDQKADVALPDLKGSWYEGRLLGLKDIGGKYFLGRCATKRGEEVWSFKLDDREGFKPMFNVRGW